MPVPGWLRKEISRKWVMIPAASICGFLAMSALVGWYFLPQWMVVDLYKANCKAGRSDCDRAIPLTDLSKTTQVGDAYQHFGLSLQFPWRIVKKKESRTVSVISFDNGDAALVFDSDLRINTEASVRNEIAGRPQIAALFDANPLRSDYQLLLAAAELEPRKFSYWMPRKEAIRDSFLAGLRLELVEPDQHGFFLIQQGPLRGFQGGIPGQDKCVRLLVFDGTVRRAELALYSHGDMKQADVNAVVSSIRITTRNE